MLQGFLKSCAQNGTNPSLRSLAKEFNCSPNTIRNELARGSHPNTGRYSAARAQRDYNSKHANSCVKPYKALQVSTYLLCRIALERDSLECFDESRLRADQSREDFARYYNTELKTLWQGLIPVGWMRIGVGEYIWFEDGSKGNMRWFNLFMGQYVELNSYSGGSYSG